MTASTASSPNFLAARSGPARAFCAHADPGTADSTILAHAVAELEHGITDAMARLSLLTRVGPMLGLMGTLIPLGPALAGLAAGDMQGMALADQALERIESELEASGVDLDCAMIGPGILEIEFDDGSKIIVNRHGVAREVWVAARSGGFHFRWDGQFWRDTKTGRELFAVLSELVSGQAGEAVALR